MIADLKLFFSDPLVAYATSVIGILASIVVSKYYYTKSRPIFELSWAVDQIPIVNTNLRDIKFPVTFNSSASKHELNWPVLAKLFLWNSGSQAIRHVDIVGNQPVRFIFKNAKIIGCALSSINTFRNVISINSQIFENENCILCEFDFLNPGEGLMIEALYDTLQQEDRKLGAPVFVFGKTIGPSLEMKIIPLSRSMNVYWRDLVVGRLMAVFLLVILLSCVPFFLGLQNLTLSFIPIAGMYFLILLICLFFVSISLLSFRGSKFISSLSRNDIIRSQNLETSSELLTDFGSRVEIFSNNRKASRRK